MSVMLLWFLLARYNKNNNKNNSKNKSQTDKVNRNQLEIPEIDQLTKHGLV